MANGASMNKMREFIKVRMLPDSLLNVYLTLSLPFLKRSWVALTLPVVFMTSACTSMEHRVDQVTQSPPIDNAPTRNASETASAQNELRFVVAGDIMVHESQLHAAYDEKCKCYDFEPVFSSVTPLFSDADVAIANLETTLPGKNYSGYPAFGAPDSLIDAIKSTGINILTTANNHCIDKGRDALIRTLRVLDEKGVPHLGTYASREEHEKQRIFIFKKNGMSVAMLNYTYGTNEIPTPKGTVVNRIDKDQISKDIALAHEKGVDAVIVFFHFGEEYLNKPDAFQREMVSHALANGADIVLGGHPHHIQPYQVFQSTGKTGVKKQHLVAYSLGNFVSAQRNRYTDGGMVLYFTLTKKQDPAGNVTLDIANVHHKLVWVYVTHHSVKKQFQILPIDAYLTSPGDIKLTDNAINEMKRFREDANKVLGLKEGDMQISAH